MCDVLKKLNIKKVERQTKDKPQHENPPTNLNNNLNKNYSVFQEQNQWKNLNLKSFLPSSTKCGQKQTGKHTFYFRRLILSVDQMHF